MKFTVATLLALAAMAFAYPAADNNVPVRRQVDAQAPAMSDGNGNVIPFDATKVKAGAAKRV
ncbi:hypothetical protein N658DRAFT_510952 [Parathielavia hyrcaniae]|uniref:Uncharacterized protein n=1 Tax=Parathielavia hyrcaniae TaxID=113614 RepID=A0AAN6PTI3_9PEZI|nr:hypothetical protein N658DRAFT_510952 [Parathielavia hyrcaniae]